MNQFVCFRGFGKEREHREGGDQNNKKDAD
jgi:hypothetical protein